MIGDYEPGKWGSSNTKGTSGGVVSWTFDTILSQYYRFDGQITYSPFQNAIQKAFDLWESIANIDFVRVSSAVPASPFVSPLIQIGWGTFDGRNGTLAETQLYYNTSSGLSLRSEIAFDSAESWSTAVDYFYTTAVHEIGHAIGLDHTSDPNSIMYPTLGDQRGPSQDDIDAIQVLYGPQIGKTTRFGATTGSDFVRGTAASEKIYAFAGNDTIVAGRGSDYVDAGDGSDTVVVDGLNSASFGFVRNGSSVYTMDAHDRSVDTIVNAEFIRSGSTTLTISALPYFNAFEYAASSNDIAMAFRVSGSGNSFDANAAANHYITTGFFEGRQIDSFDASQYLSNYSDLRAAFGGDLAAATRHFLAYGVVEHRLAENPLTYVASYGDLITAFSGGTASQIASSGFLHYEKFGFGEGRRANIDFNAKEYLENYSDLAAAFGSNESLATLHFIKNGYTEHRLSSDALEYVASHSDLIQAFHGRGKAQIEHDGAGHYSAYGFAEKRAVDRFDVDHYLENYADLRNAFSDGHGGYNTEAATLHFIQNGYFEGRSDILIA